MFGVIAGVLLRCCTPDITWINTNADGPHYLYAAKYLYPAHKTSAPLFLLLGHVMLYLPWGTEAWRIALLSVVGGIGSAVFVYLAIRHHLAEVGRLESVERERFLALVGAVVFGGSALIVSQATIVEGSYALTMMCGVGAYYFCLKGRWIPAALMIGAGVAMHHLIIFPAIVCFVLFKGFRQKKTVAIMAGFLAFYLYIPLVSYFNPSPDMWGNTTMGDFWNDNLSTMLMLWGGLAIWDLPKRLLDTALIMGASLWLAVVPMWRYVRTKHDGPHPIRRQHWREPLLWLVGIPVVYFATNLAPQTYVYMIMALPFAAIMAGVGLSRMKKNWAFAVFGVALVALGFNGARLDIGSPYGIDPDLSARRYYDVELAKVPDNGILIAQHGWEWAIVYLYNKEEGRNVLPVHPGTLGGVGYRRQLREMGIVVGEPEEGMGNLEKQDYLVQSIIDGNEGIWVTSPTDARNFGVEVVALAEYEGSLIIGEIEPDTSVKWRPSDPYDFITGAIEVEEWVYIVHSNYSVATFVMLGVIGMVPVWVIWKGVLKRKKWSWGKVKGEVRELV